jgi:PA14 domain/Chitobiase/beta-hexosaminidase C-terminal domain
VVPQGSVPGVGDGHDAAGNVPFVQLKHHNREALLLLNGTLMVPFTGHYDYSPYHGWIFTFNAYSLAQTGIWNVSPNGAGGGFWQAACGPAADSAGYVYIESGNGTWDSTNFSFGDSVIKLAITNGINVVDWFTPYNQLDLFIRDIDVGSAGQILLPDSAGSLTHPHLMVAGSKTGTFYLLDRDNMGHFNAAGDTQIVQEISGAVNGMWCTPAFFNGLLYYVGSGDRLKAFALTNGTVYTTPLSQSPNTHSGNGSSPVISANGTNNAIAWVLETGNSPAVLHAYNATNVAQELYNSSQNSARDNPGSRVKWVVPPVANGKVYVASQNALTIYGTSIFLPAPVISPAGGSFTNFATVTLSDSMNDVTMYYTLDGSTPTTNSTLYTGPFQVTQTVGVQAIATLPGAANSPVAVATFINSDTIGRGTGLLGQYYSNSFPANPFIGSPLVRTDAVINFNWNSVAPAPGFPTTNYTVRWTGMVQPDFNEDYTFYTTTDDGVRLWVNGQLLIDKWVAQSPTTWNGTISLRAHQLYLIEMDYYQAGGGAVAQLAWSSRSTAQNTIPQSQLYPITTLPSVYFTSASVVSNQVFQAQASGMAGQWYVLQGTTNLLNWVSLGTNIAPANVFNVIDAGASNYPQRFYRITGQP